MENKLTWARSSDVYYIIEDANRKRCWNGLLNYRNLSGEELAEADLSSFLSNFEGAMKIKGNYDLQHFAKMHKYIWEDLYPWAGNLRNYVVVKRESILEGKSVNYCPPENINNNFELFIEPLLNKHLKEKSIEEQVEIISNAYHGIWQTHCFPEGNTRLTTIFVISALRKSGIKLDVDYLTDRNLNLRDTLSIYSTFQNEMMKPFETIIKNALSPISKRESVKIPEKILYNKYIKKFVTNSKSKNEEKEMEL